MKIKDNILSEAIKQLVSAISGVLILLIYSLYSDLIPIIAQKVIPNVSKQVLLKITTLATVLFILSAVLSFVFYLKLKIKLIPKFGVLWDKNKETYCTACQVPLSRYTEDISPSGKKSYFFRCVKCDKVLYLVDDGIPIRIQDARKRL